jgi:DNA-directed RNA polymerase subunit RPC12/RpoP
MQHHHLDSRSSSESDGRRASPSDKEADTLVVISHYDSIPDAELARGRLESEDIPAFVFDENMAGAQWFYSMAIGGTRLMVRAQDASKAAEILSLEPIKEEELAREAGATEKVYCPKCGSKDTVLGFSSRLGWRWLTPIGILLTYIMPAFVGPGAPLLFFCPWGYRCRSCGYKWRKQKAEKPTK